MRFDKLFRSHAYTQSKKASRKNLFEFLERAIVVHQLQSPRASLNIGSGGDIESCLQALNVSAVSIDIDPDRKPDIVGSVDRMTMFEDESFDSIFCMEVLEHVTDPFSSAKEISRVLRPGGLLVGSTPFVFGIHDSPHDYFRYTKYGLAHLFRTLNTVEITARNTAFESAVVIPLRIFVVVTESEKRKLARRWPLLRTANWLYKIAGYGIENQDATTGYFFVFQKPI